MRMYAIRPFFPGGVAFESAGSSTARTVATSSAKTAMGAKAI